MKGKKTGGRKPGSLNKVTAAVQRRLAQSELSAQATVEAIRRGALGDVRRLFDSAGDLKPITELDEEDAWLIAGFDVVRRNLESGDGHSDTIVKVKLIDRARYVEMAAKHHGLMVERHEHSMTDAMLERLDRGRLRSAGLLKD